MPVTTWTAAARALAMSDDTLARHRKRLGDRTRVPWWRDEDAVRAWFEALIAPPPVPERRRSQPRRRREPDAPLDLEALRAEVL